MKILNYTASILFFSCTQDVDYSRWGQFSRVEVSTDTLLVNSNTEILYLRSELSGSEMSLDKKYLYNFNPSDHTLEKINLSSLKLDGKLPFEKHGPNGTGQFIGYLRIPAENQIQINGLNKSEIFTLDGLKLKSVYFEDYIDDSDGGEKVLIPSPIIDSDHGHLYGLTTRELDKVHFFSIFNLDNSDLKRIKLDAFKDLSKFTFTLWIKGSSFVMGPRVNLDKFDTKVVLSNQVTNTLTVYDTFLDSLYVKTYDSRITANKKTNEYKLEHESEERLNAEYARFHEEINFLPPFWDERKQLFYRFSYVQLPSVTDDPEDVKSTIYLSAFDKDLNLVGEMVVPQLSKPPETPFSNPFPKHFAKDGKIWIYENLNDEMGFVVLTLNR